MGKQLKVKEPPVSPETAPSGAEGTVGDYISYLIGGSIQQKEPAFLAWPPDVFAVAASVLRDSGAYVHVTTQWPPCGKSRLYCFLDKEQRDRVKTATECDGECWESCIRLVGQEWQKTAASTDFPPIHKSPPRQILDWWGVIAGLTRLKMLELTKTENQRTARLVEHFLLLLAAADEASAGFGLSASLSLQEASKDNPEFMTWLRAHANLAVTADEGRSTLNEAIDRSKAVVLPKAHTPQSGVTIRSFSHHLALMPRADVDARWFPPLDPFKKDGDEGYNILLIPWPFEVVPKQFRAVSPADVESSINIRNLPSNNRFFAFEPPPIRKKDLSLFRSICRKAKAVLGEIHAVVLPECAIRSRQVDDVVNCFRREGIDLFIAGVAGMRRQRLPLNCAVIRLRSRGGVLKRKHLASVQPKHHRWFMDRRQVEQYGLGSVLHLGELPESMRWWEYMAIQRREVHFVHQRDWLALSIMVCEDLTRPDPLGDVIRAVGPNLVIALLQDAPQLERRWSARAATVLADDPGSCVLTLTSLGMAMLSHPMGGEPASRAVALWRQPHGGARELKLPEGHQALALSLAKARAMEWSADGRNDGGMAGYPVLAGIHAIKI